MVIAMRRVPSRPKFRRPFRRRSSGLMQWWLVWRVPALAAIVMAVWWFAIRPIASEQGWVPVTESFALCGEGTRAAGCVIDGDTVFLGFGPNQRRIRLTGFDAPELDGACETETRLAIGARQRLYEWLQEGAFEWNGSEEPPRDQYGRELRAARRQSQEGEEALADVMIASGLASASGWGSGPADWCAN